MVPFLQRLADQILARNRGELEHIAVVLPSRRAGLYLRKYLAEAAGATFWSPDVLDPGAFLERIAGLRQGGTVELLLALYEVHRTTLGDRAEPLAEFLRWAPVTLRDMSEIDAHLLDLDQVYRDLTAYHEIETWSFLGTAELSRSQRSAQEQWVRMGELHRQANRVLEERGIATSGAIARKAAEDSADTKWNPPWRHVWVAGLNALDPATTSVLRQLTERDAMSLAWDADRFYLDDDAHEAGRFLRRSISDLGQGTILRVNEIRERDRTIDAITVPDNMAAVHVAAEWASRLSASQRDRAVIILADEALLLPLLNTLPADIGAVNVTMGLPLESLPVHGLVERFLQLARAAQAGQLPRDETQLLLLHPFLHRGEATTKLLEAWNAPRASGWALVDMDRMMRDHAFPDRAHAMSALRACAEASDPSGWVQRLIAWAVVVQAGDRLGTEQLYHLAQAERELAASLAHAGLGTLDAEAYAAVRHRAMRGYRLALFGEPLAGMQVMGMLETRAIDHAHVLVLGATEGLLGGTDPVQSWIPFDLRRHYKLPLRADAEAITSYHVHRLLHQAESLCLVHALGADGSGAAARFTAQWEHELAPSSRTTMHERVRHVPAIIRRPPVIAVEKSDSVREKLAQLGAKGFSPSALGTWLQCPLDFYFKHVMGLKDRSVIPGELGSDILGKAVHKVLEDIYRPCLDVAMNATHLRGASDTVDERLMHQLSQEVPAATLRTGDHRLRAAMATEALRRYLRAEADRCERMAITPRAVETKLVGTLPGDRRIAGTCDRMEERNGLLHLLDIKTGTVRGDDLKLKGLEREQLQRRHRYVLQLIMYAFMAFQRDDELNNIRAGVLPLRTPSLTEGLWLRIAGADILDRSMMADMGSLIGALVTELLDAELPFMHDPESEHCTYCVA